MAIDNIIQPDEFSDLAVGSVVSLRSIHESGKANDAFYVIVENETHPFMYGLFSPDTPNNEVLFRVSNMHADKLSDDYGKGHGYVLQNREDFAGWKYDDRKVDAIGVLR